MFGIGSSIHSVGGMDTQPEGGRMTLKRYTTSHGTMCDSAEVADLEFKHQELKIASAELVFLLGMTPVKSHVHELTALCNKVLQLIGMPKGGANEQ